MIKIDQILVRWVFFEDISEFNVKDTKEIIDNIKSHKLLNISNKGGDVYSIKQQSWYASPHILSLFLGEVVMKIIPDESKVLIKSKPSKVFTITTLFSTAVLLVAMLIITLKTQNLIHTMAVFFVLFIFWFVGTKVAIALNELVVDKIVGVQSHSFFIIIVMYNIYMASNVKWQ